MCLVSFLLREPAPHLTPISLHLPPLRDLCFVITGAPPPRCPPPQSLGDETLSCQSPKYKAPVRSPYLLPPCLPIPLSPVSWNWTSPSWADSERVLPLCPTPSIYEPLLSAPTLPRSCTDHTHTVPAKLCKTRVDVRKVLSPIQPTVPS